MKPHGHMGIAEIAELLGVSRQRVHVIRSTYADFPAAASELKRGPIWHERDILAWVEKHRPDRNKPPTTSRPNRPKL